MPLPSFRHSKSKVRRRRSHDALKTVGLSACSKCKAPILPHRACAECGTYAGRQVIKMDAAVEKTIKKAAKAKKAAKPEAVEEKEAE